jgi:uncharacterized protein
VVVVPSFRLSHKLKYRILPEPLAVCQLPAGTRVPEWALRGGFFSVAETEDEVSIVCEELQVADGLRAEKGWLGLKLEGPFPFTMTGILTSFLQPLAEACIPVFVVSTFNTDYVLIKREHLERALKALGEAGHERIGSTKP